ncbi:MAG TPA: TonB family protein [Candidatus Sulfotelmatobacter sp.]|nr:TonB family protein [Candidatus Sulfotelmatobacter sp.]
MGDLPLPTTSGSILFGEALPSPDDAYASDARDAGENLALLDVLRQAVVVGTQSADSILESIAEAAGVLSGANGIALALRQNGVIVCRARSGDIAPELGSPLNTDSGISGECLRTAAILVCSDTATDKRVDSEVCDRLGVRSIVAVPLRGQMGMVGILEAFSARMDAFEKDQIEALRALGEIAEHAYERERRRLDPTAPPRSRVSFASAAEKPDRAQRTIAGIPLKREYWIIGAVAAAVLLVSLVIGLSWRQTGADIAANEPGKPAKSMAPRSTSRENPSSAATGVPATDRGPAIPIHESKRETSGQLVHKAAEISPATDQPNSSSSAPDTAATNASTAPAANTGSSNDVAPAIALMPSQTPDSLSTIGSGTAAMPTFGGNVSQGLAQATLVKKVEPDYPMQALKQKIAGTVTLEAIVADTGNVRAVSVVSGPPQLAYAARDAVRQWKYNPAVLNGKPVESQKQITVIFKLP